MAQTETIAMIHDSAMTAPANSPLIRDAKSIWQAGVAAVDAQKLVRDFVVVTPQELRVGNCKFALDSFDRLIVVGGGKATGWMATGLEQALGQTLLKQKQVIGRINVPDDQWTETDAIEVVRCRPPGQNLPTQRVIESTSEIVRLLNGSEPNSLCICLISGGGSALLELPVAPVNLDELRSVTSLMAANGAPIEALNTVRRQISQVKAGGLARAAACNNLVTLIVSDVLGDRIDMIASGPTVADISEESSIESKKLAYETLLQYCGSESAVPASIRRVLQQTTGGLIAMKNPDLGLHHFVIGNNQMAVEAAAMKAKKLGYQCQTETSLEECDAEKVAQRLLQKNRELRVSDSLAVGAAFISGGEPTVDLSEAAGQGGRNQHLVLAAMLQSLEDQQAVGDFGFLSAGTDGEDGNVPVAGAFFDGNIINQFQDSDWRKRISAALRSHDSYPVLRELGCILEVPPTRTNVCDLRIILKPG